MKKVLLLGDSIRMGYDDYVKELLKDKCEVYYAPDDNGRFSAYTLWQANQLFKLYGKFDVVHWNNGYWDMNVEPPMQEEFHPIPEYKHMLKRIIKLCKSNSKYIIFATTTPLLDKINAFDNSGTSAQMNYDNDSVIKYNKAALEVMKEEEIIVNDLYTLLLNDNNYYKCEDSLHLTYEGYKVCAIQIANMIEKLI